MIITLFKKDKNKVPKIASIEKKKYNEQDTPLTEINNKLKQLENAIESLNKKALEQNINIDKLEIHNPILKELSFNLESLDIKELSGSLVIGTHFGAITDKVSKEKTKKQEDQKQVKDSVVITFDKNRKNGNTDT